MTEKELFQEIGNIKEEYLTEAEEYKANILRSVMWKRTLVTAASLVVCFGIYWGTRQVTMEESATASDVAKQENVEYTNWAEEEAGTADFAQGVQENFMQEKPAGESNMPVDSMQEAAEPEAMNSQESAEEKTDGMVQMESLKENMKQNQWAVFLKAVEAGRPAEIDLLTEALEGNRLFFDGELFYITSVAIEDKVASDTEQGDSYAAIYVIQLANVTQIILSKEPDLTQEQILSGEYETCLVAEYETEP